MNILFRKQKKSMDSEWTIFDKNNSLFYSLDTNQNLLIILTFYDNRQDPKKLKVH
jgi:hypothetical protein